MKKVKLLLIGAISLVVFGFLLPQPIQALLVIIDTHTSHTQTTPETVYFKEFSSENSHAACAKPLATDKTLCK